MIFNLGALPYRGDREPSREASSRLERAAARLWSRDSAKAPSDEPCPLTLKVTSPPAVTRLILLKSALGTGDHSELFKTTETYRAGAEGRAKIDSLLRTLYSLLEDLMFLQSGTAQLVRNTDILGELKKLSESCRLRLVATRLRRTW